MQHTTCLAPRRRPLGVTIIAVLAALQGAFLLIISGIGLVAFLAAPSTAQAPLGSLVVAGSIGALLPLVGLLLLLVAWGLWTLKRWAFWVTVAVQLFSIFSSLGLLSQTGNSTTTATTSNIAFAVIIVIYLFADRHVRAAFHT